MCKGLEFGEVLMCTSSKETSSVEQRKGRAEGGKTKRVDGPVCRPEVSHTKKVITTGKKSI